jgi:hypothetical protein
MLAMVAAIAALQTLGETFGKRFMVNRERLVIAAALSSMTIGLFGHFGRGPLWTFRQPHFAKPAAAANATNLLMRIPPDASVAAQNNLLAHLAARDALYELNVPIKADYVALDFSQGTWPFPADYPMQLSKDLRAAGYGIFACQGSAVILKRAYQSGLSCDAMDSR